MITTRITDIKSTFWRLFKLFIPFLFFLVIASNAASSTDPATMTLSSLGETLEGKDAKKRKKRAGNNDDQASYQEEFLALQKKQLENQVA